MKKPKRISLSHRIEGGALLALRGAISLLPYRAQSRVGGFLLACVIMAVPSARRRILNNLALVFPERAEEHRRLAWSIAYSISRTILEMLNSQGLEPLVRQSKVYGDGLKVIKQLKAEGKGAVMVSGHFGQYEAMRAYLKLAGLETGVLFRPQNNPIIDRMQREQLVRWGEPIFETGRRGMLNLARHVENGGFASLLVDQRYPGVVQDFLGQPALTSTAAAELALKFDVPLITAFCVRTGDTFEIEYETPVPRGTPEEMMQEVQNRLAARVRAHPEQWYWLHNRWKMPPDQAPAQKTAS